MNEALEQLAARCERATGPDREIDRDIALAFGLYDQPEDLGCFKDKAEAVVGGGGQTWAAPSFTACLDAALTLVPEDCAFRLYHWPKQTEGDRACALAEGGKESWSATPALALCAAALRARAAQA